MFARGIRLTCWDEGNEIERATNGDALSDEFDDENELVDDEIEKDEFVMGINLHNNVEMNRGENSGTLKNWDKLEKLEFQN